MRLAGEDHAQNLRPYAQETHSIERIEHRLPLPLLRRDQNVYVEGSDRVPGSRAGTAVGPRSGYDC